MRKKIILIVAIILGLLFARMIFSGIMHSKNAKIQKSKSIPSVTVEQIKTRHINRKFEANARVVAKYRVNILSRINGYLTKSYFTEGDYVKAGQVLFEVEPQEYQYAANKAKANLNNVQSQALYYNKQLSRYKELVSKDYVAKSDYDNILAQSTAFNAQVDSATSAYRDAQRNLGYTKIKSPVNGRVGIIAVTVGNYVSMNSGALTTINSSEPMYITFPLNAKDYADLVRIDGANVNRDVEFTFSTGKKYEFMGVQDFHDNKIDETTGTITLRATFKNPKDELLQGDFGKVTIYSKLKDDVPIVPQSATQENQEGIYVYILDSNNIPKLVYIKTMGQTEDGMWLVSEGVKPGDCLVTTGFQKIVPGSPVKIVKTTIDTQKNSKKENIILRIMRKIRHIFKK